MAAKGATLDQTQGVHVIYDFFKDFQTWISKSKSITTSDLERHFSKDFHLKNNGQVICKSASEYITRLQRFEKKYSRFEISQPLEEPIMQGNHIVIYYQVDLTTHNNQHKQIQIMAIATIEDNRIHSWHQVVHEKGAGDWDK